MLFDLLFGIAPLGTTIKQFNKYLSNKQRIKLVEQQLLSEKVLDRKRAYFLIDESFVCQIEEKLWEAWELYSDNNCIAILAIMGNMQLLIQNFYDIWHNDNVIFYIKNNLLKKVAILDFNTVKFLKEEAPVSYLSACVAANKSVDDVFVLSVVENSSKINEFSYIIWLLGKLGKESILYNLLNELESIEKKFPIETWEPEFYQ
ncbi:MAG: hypothetical protein D3922_09100 [Candidatus Electrothrix sp. AR1]|nr:hypothetical protein [Candidatus Electrothrix sp. AR1]